MSDMHVYIDVNKLESLKLRKGILNDSQLAQRAGMHPSQISKIKKQGRCQYANARKIAGALGSWEFRIYPFADYDYRADLVSTGLIPSEEPIIEKPQEDLRLGLILNQNRYPNASAYIEFEKTVRQFINKPVFLHWNLLAIEERLSFWELLEKDPLMGAYMHRVYRDRVCAREVWCEAFNLPLTHLTRYDVKRINSIINYDPHWKKAPNSIRFGPYGKHRGFVSV